MQSQMFAGRLQPDTSSRQLPFRQQQQIADRARRRLNVQAAGSTYGTNFRVTTFGESHGKAVGCVIDGVPPRLPITQEEIQVKGSTCCLVEGIRAWPTTQSEPTAAIHEI